MKKNLILIILMIIVTGCKKTLDYNLIINKKTKINSQEFLNEAYKDKNGVISEEEKKIIAEQGCATVYGEILPTSLKTLLDDLRITSNDVFYDLGSGIGKVTIQAYLDYPFKKAVGIELSPTRCNHAISAYNMLKIKNAIAHHRTLEFKIEDITKSDLNDATVIFMCSTCFPDDLMVKLTKKLSTLKSGLKVLTLKLLSTPEKYGFKQIKEYNLPMTWSSTTPVYSYQLNS